MTVSPDWMPALAAFPTHTRWGKVGRATCRVKRGEWKVGSTTTRTRRGLDLQSVVSLGKLEAERLLHIDLDLLRTAFGGHLDGRAGREGARACLRSSHPDLNDIERRREQRRERRREQRREQRREHRAEKTQARSTETEGVASEDARSVVLSPRSRRPPRSRLDKTNARHHNINDASERTESRRWSC